MKELNILFVSFVLSILLAGPIFADIIELNDENDSCSASSKSDFGWITHHLYTNNLLQCNVQLKPEARTLAGTTSQTNDVILITRYFLTGGSAKIRINDVAVSSLKKGDMPGVPDDFPPCYVLAPMEMSSACEKKMKDLEDRHECKVLYSQEGQVTSVKLDIRSRGYVNMFAHYQFYRCDPSSRDKKEEEEKEPPASSTKTDDTQQFYIIIIAVISGCLVLVVAIFSFNNCRRRKPSGTNHTPSSQTTSISTINQPSAPAINMRPLASLPRGTTKTPPPCYQEFAEYEECGPTAPPGGSASNSCGGGGGWSGKSPDSPRYVSPQPAYNFANDEDPTYCELGDN